MTICDRLLLCGSRLCTSSNNATPLVYLVRLSTTSTTFVTKVMGSTGDVELDLRAALASAPLDRAHGTRVVDSSRSSEAEPSLAVGTGTADGGCCSQPAAPYKT